MILAYWHLAEPGVVPYIPGTPVKLGLVPAHEYGEPPYAISRAVISELAIRNPKPSLVAMSLNAMEYMDEIDEIDEALLDSCKKANIIVVTGYSDGTAIVNSQFVKIKEPKGGAEEVYQKLAEIVK